MFVQAELGRAGLANRLFCWGRAEAAASRHGLPMLAPQWVRLKLGPILRGERDRRFYTSLFTNRGYVSGARAWATRARLPIVEEQQLPATLERPGRGAVVRFTGMEQFFEPIHDDQPLLQRRLWDITAPTIRQDVERLTPQVGPIVMHVRRGDMPSVRPGQAVSLKSLCQLPTSWFVGVAECLRERFGADTPISVFSDGRDEELAELLALPNTHRVDGGRALTDIWLISRGRAVVTSGPSTFSLWGTYLGGCAAITYPGFDRPISPATDIYSVETDQAGNLDAEALDRLAPALQDTTGTV
ncbi:MAG: hypothetical protein AAGH92_06725 [Planctomycetota bacterium]